MSRFHMPGAILCLIVPLILAAQTPDAVRSYLRKSPAATTSLAGITNQLPARSVQFSIKVII